MTGGLRTVLLAVHVAAGSAALLLALALLVRRGSWAGPGGGAYLAAVLSACGTALVLAAWGSDLPGAARVVLAVVAGLTAAAAAAGVRGARRRTAGHLRLLHGSVVSLVTAVAVVSAPVAVWIAVAVLGTVLVERAASRRRRAARPGPVTSTGPRAGAASR